MKYGGGTELGARIHTGRGDLSGQGAPPPPAATSTASPIPGVHTFVGTHAFRISLCTLQAETSVRPFLFYSEQSLD